MKAVRKVEWAPAIEKRHKGNIEFRTPIDSIGTGKEYRMTKGISIDY